MSHKRRGCPNRPDLSHLTPTHPFSHNDKAVYKRTSGQVGEVGTVDRPRAPAATQPRRYPEPARRRLARPASVACGPGGCRWSYPDGSALDGARAPIAAPFPASNAADSAEKPRSRRGTEVPSPDFDMTNAHPDPLDAEIEANLRAYREVQAAFAALDAAKRGPDRMAVVRAAVRLLALAGLLPADRAHALLADCEVPS